MPKDSSNPPLSPGDRALGSAVILLVTIFAVRHMLPSFNSVVVAHFAPIDERDRLTGLAEAIDGGLISLALAGGFGLAIRLHCRSYTIWLMVVPICVAVGTMVQTYLHVLSWLLRSGSLRQMTVGVGLPAAGLAASVALIMWFLDERPSHTSNSSA